MTTNPVASLSLQQLKQIIAIRERIDELEKELDQVVGGQASLAKEARPRRKRRFSAATRAKLSAAMKGRWAKRKSKKRVKRLRSKSAPLKERIVGTLKAAGKSGATVKELAAKLGKSYGNVSVWFHTTGKGIKEIKKVEPGRFAWAS